jgi:trans-aconitate 2-methyltransferase
MRSGGRFVAEGGGAGNVEGFRRALRQVGGSGGEEIWNFATIDDTARKLAEAGFIDIDVRLIPDPARLERGEQLEAFLATVMLGVQLRELAPEQRRPFVRAVMQEMPEPVVDFVRLQLSATRR